MALVECKRCGRLVDEEVPVCPHCGGPVKPTRSRTALQAVIIGLALVAVVVLVLSLLAPRQAPEGEPALEVRSDDARSSVGSFSYFSSGSGGRSTALDKARSYLGMNSGFSREQLIRQLEYEGFSSAEAARAADASGADWNSEALKKAKSYLRMNSGFSDKSLRKQLDFEGFTDGQIDYAMARCGADWNSEAAKKAKSYLRSMPDMTRARLQRQLEYEGFTAAQVTYGLSQCGKGW